jgi:hypothetical protein
LCLLLGFSGFYDISYFGLLVIKLETCFKYVEDNLELIHHDLVVVYDQPSFFRRHVTCSRQLKSLMIKDLLIKGKAIVNSTVIVRKKLLTKVGGISEDKIWLRRKIAIHG